MGHKGKFGHEFLEFELTEDGELRYANDSRYRRESIIRKQLCVSSSVVAEFRRIINASGILEFVLPFLSLSLSAQQLASRTALHRTVLLQTNEKTGRTTPSGRCPTRTASRSSRL